MSGGSGTRLALADASGRLLRQEHCGSASPHYRKPPSFTNTLVHALSRVLASDAPRVHAAGVPLAGVDLSLSHDGPFVAAAIARDG